MRVAIARVCQNCGADPNTTLESGFTFYNVQCPLCHHTVTNERFVKTVSMIDGVATLESLQNLL